MNFTAIRIGIKIRKAFTELIQILCGTAIMAAATSFFLLPNQLSSGGFSGIATILYYFFQFPMGISILVLNIPLFIISIFKKGRKFFFKAILGTTFLSVFIDLFDQYPALTQDRLLACIYGGILIGVGTAIILKANASTGGTDLSAQIIRRYKPEFRAGTLITTFDIMIVGLNVFFFREIEIGLYSAITIYIMGKVIDVFFEGIYFTKMMYIISDQYEKIAINIQADARKRYNRNSCKRNVYKSRKNVIIMCSIKRGSRTDKKNR